MSFPWHNRGWREAAEFLGARARPGERVLAPDAFWLIVAAVDRYVPANLEPECTYDWVVLEADGIAEVPRVFLEHIDAEMTPVFANDTFVIWTRLGEYEPLASSQPFLETTRAKVAELGDEPRPNLCVEDLAIADAPSIRKHAALSDRDLRDAMDEMFEHTGYRYPTHRDATYRGEMVAIVRTFLEGCDGLVLELCAGSLRSEAPADVDLVRIELSEVGIRLAKTADVGQGNVHHLAMDAHKLGFRDRAFNGALFVDSIEHVRDAERVIQEAARVLRPGSGLLVSFANRRSVHLVLSQKLGYPEFLTNHQHIREFTLDEVRQMLEVAGFEIERTEGVLLYPYWGIPGVDEAVREITDDDPQFVELMRDLGQRVGAEHAYTGVVMARLTH